VRFVGALHLGCDLGLAGAAVSTPGCAGTASGRSGQAAAAHPPEADPRQGDGGGKEDRRLIPLERPEAAGGLVGHQLPEVEPGYRGLAGLEGIGLA
jgi:hypothetical protein